MTRSSRSAKVSIEPAVLLVGADRSLELALRGALERHSVYVETTTAAGAVEAVTVTAPDLVLLAGDAAQDGGSAILSKLSQTPGSSVVPIAILGDDAGLDARLRAFRFGAAAVIQRSASIDAIADQVAGLAREIPDRRFGAFGRIGEATLDEFVGALSRELRSGILSVKPSDTDSGEELRLVLGSGKPLADAVEQFVSRVRRYVVSAEPLSYEFDERAGGTLQLFGDEPATDGGRAVGLEGIRLVLADDDAARADHVAQQLRSRGLSVVVTDLMPSELRLSRLRQVDPSVLLIGEEHVKGAGYELVRRMRRDQRLRWASLLVVRWDQVWSEQLKIPTLERLSQALWGLGDVERSIAERAKSGASFDVRLEVVGGPRLLRTLAACSLPLRISVTHPRVSLAIDLAEGLVVGSTGSVLESGVILEGPAALSALLVLSSGRVRVERVSDPAVANLMATVDVALSLADTEEPPIQPSLLPEPMSLAPPSLPAAQPALPPIQIRERLEGLWRAFSPRGRILVSRVRERLRTTPRPKLRWLGAAMLAPALLLLLVATSGRGAPRPPASHAVSAAKNAVGRAALALRPRVVPVTAPNVLDWPAEPNVNTATCTELLGADGPRGRNPGAALEQLLLGRKELVRGHMREALTHYCRAEAWDVDNTNVLLELGRSVLMTGDGVRAKTYAERALSRAPENEHVLRLWSDVLARNGQAEPARAALLRASGAADKPGVYQALARAELADAAKALRRQDYETAERLYRRAAVLDPKSAEASAGLSRSLVQQDSGTVALAWARRAVALGPENADVQVALGDALAKTGDPEAARAAWRAATMLDPNHRGAKRRLRP